MYNNSIFKRNNIFDSVFRQGLKPTENITVTEWANLYRMLPASTTAESGLYSSKRTPFLEEIGDNLSNSSPIRKVSFMKSAQVGGSELGNNFLGYIMSKSPASTLVVQPTVDVARNFAKERIIPMIKESDILSKLVDFGKNQSTQNVLFFPNGQCKIVGANSPNGLASTPVQYLFCDEVDRYPLSAGGEGNPLELAEKRTTTFMSNRKVFFNSTPTNSSTSMIYKEYLKGDQRQFNLPCPKCNGYQPLDFFKGLKFKINKKNSIEVEKNSVYYECMYCKYKIQEFEKTEMMNKGKWVSTNPNAEEYHTSYHINALYSPIGWKSWEDICNEFLRVKDDKYSFQTFYNTTLGLPFAEKIEKPDYEFLYNRKGKFKSFTAPDDCIYVNAGIDTQNNRFAITLVGYGSNMNIYVIDYKEILGDPSEKETQDKLIEYLRTPIQHESGVKLYVSKGIIDTGGGKTQDIYNLCNQYKSLLIPIKGDIDFGFYVKNGDGVEKDAEGQKIGDLNIYRINTILTKKTIYSMLEKKDNKNNGGFIHFNEDLPIEFFEMITSEIFVLNYVKGVAKESFKKVTTDARNEALDCLVYSIAIAFSNNLHHWVDSVYLAKYKHYIGFDKKDASVVDNVKLNNNTKQQNVVNNKLGLKKTSILNIRR